MKNYCTYGGCKEDIAYAIISDGKINRITFS